MLLIHTISKNTHQNPNQLSIIRKPQKIYQKLALKKYILDNFKNM